MMINILLVDDEKEILALNKEMLERRGGYSVSLAADLAEARLAIARSQPDVIILDIMLPDGSGLDFYAELKQTRDIPVLFLSGRSGQQDKNVGLSLGADDYITKPYDNDELLMRIEAVLRRANRLPRTVKIGPFDIVMNSNRVLFNNAELPMQKREFDVLYFLLQNLGRTVSMEEIYQEVWTRQTHGDIRAVRQAINKLQNTLKGTGYELASAYGKGSYVLRQEE